jgi:hypothetical protein
MPKVIVNCLKYVCPQSNSENCKEEQGANLSGNLVPPNIENPKA